MFLFGAYRYSGRDYTSRKALLQERLRELTAIFAVHACVWAMLSNHFHLIVRNRPDLAQQFSDEEVANEVVRAMGIVFGDIGTSPIYTLTIIFFLIPPTQENIIGVLSLIFCTLIIIVTIQYAWLGMSLSIKGEGGIIVLKEALMSTHKKGKRLSIASAFAYIGISLLIGDGIITPAISILSAGEELELIPDFGEVTALVVVLITCLITIILFLMQARGVDRIAKSFGPIMLIWFV